MHNLENTVALLQPLGFTINPDQLQLIPTQKMTCLGLVIDSTTMTLKLKLIQLEKVLVLQSAGLFALQEYCTWQNCSFKAAKGYFECKKMSILTAAKIEVALWKNNIYTRYYN